MSNANLAIGLIGLGEVGQRLAADFRAAGIGRIAAFDIAFADASSAQARAARSLGVEIERSPAAAVAGKHLVVCAVTAGSDLDAARAAAPALPEGCFWVDVNSVAPNTKREAAAIIGKGRARYVEAAVMSPIDPRGIATPILLGGPNGAAFLEIAAPLGFNAKPYSDEIGRASSVKMCRSIMIKGIESLVAECLITCHHYGVTDDVLASLADLFPGHDWDKTARYMLSRTLEHGTRRSEEMVEVAKTVADAGLEPMMARATVERQAWAAELGRQVSEPGSVTVGRDERLAELRRVIGHESRRP